MFWNRERDFASANPLRRIVRRFTPTRENWKSLSVASGLSQNLTIPHLDLEWISLG